MQKMVAVMSRQVKDLAGLYVELRKQGFGIVNVGSDYAGTYVYLTENESKDPTPLVEEWVKKPVPAPTKHEAKRLKENLKKISTAESLAQEQPNQEAEKTGFLKGIFKKIFPTKS